MSKPKEDKNINIPLDVLANLLTPSEIRMLKNRWQIILLLEQGLSIRRVAEQVKVGTDTVVRVAKLKGDTSKKISATKVNSQLQNTTSWVFGKTEE
jgi:uncharacterized protein YerC